MAWYERGYEEERRPMGGGLRGHSVVMWLIGINAAVFVLDMIFSTGMRTQAVSPSYWGNYNVADGVFGLQVWRWITYQFLHDGFFHVLFNLLAIYFFGPMIEGWLGGRRFLAFYLLCGTCGALVYTLVVLTAPGLIFPPGTPARVVPIVGASGAVFGILVAAAVLFPTQRVMLLSPPIPMTLRTMALLFLGLAVLSLLAGSANAGGEAAHLGGAVLGYVLIRYPRLLAWAEGVDPGTVRTSLQRRKAERARQAVEDDEKELDRILDKVRQHGLHSLTRGEQRTLRRNTERKRRAG